MKNVALTSGSSQIMCKPLFRSRLGCKVGRGKVKKACQCFQAFVHSFHIHFLHVIQVETWP